MIAYRKEDDGGVYFCQAENSDGMTRSKNATLTVAGKNESCFLSCLKVMLPHPFFMMQFLYILLCLMATTQKVVIVIFVT